MNATLIPNKTRLFEITAVVLTATGKFVFMDYLEWRFAFVSTAIICWTVYIIYRINNDKEIAKYWGFRTDNFALVAKKVLPFGIIAVVSFFIIGFIQNSLNISWHLIPILISYPIWGVIQQFLLIALTAGNLQDMQGQKINKWIIILIAALLFAVVHYPFVWLIIATFSLAVFYGYIYLNNRNIYVLGLFHGWLGGLFFYTVVGRDPFEEMFGKLF